jgi:ribosome production factor 1
MAKEKKRKQPSSDGATPQGGEGEERRERKDKRPKKDKAAAILPSQIKNKDKRSELHAKLKREKKAEKRKLARERSQAIRRAEELGEQARMLYSDCPTPPVEFRVLVWF